jgi:hypothetical protein
MVINKIINHEWKNDGCGYIFKVCNDCTWMWNGFQGIVTAGSPLDPHANPFRPTKTSGDRGSWPILVNVHLPIFLGGEIN